MFPFSIFFLLVYFSCWYMFPVSIFFLRVYFPLLLYFFLLLISLHFPVIVSLPIIAFLFFNCYFPFHYFISLCDYSIPYHYISILYYHIFSGQVDSVLLLISFITCLYLTVHRMYSALILTFQRCNFNNILLGSNIDPLEGQKQVPCLFF